MIYFVKAAKLLSLTVGIVATAAVVANAADMKAPAASSDSYDWSGVFVGANVGGAWNPASYTHVETAGVGGAAVNREAFSTNGSSVLGGFQIGAQHQFERFVVGAEGGYSFFDATDSERTNLNGIPRIRETELKDLWHISARFGYAFDRILPYVKAGYANSELKYTNTRIADGVIVGQSSDRAGGLTVGGGVDFALTENWILGAEYSFTKFNVGSQQQTRGGVPVSAFNASNDVDLHTFALKVNYKF